MRPFQVTGSAVQIGPGEQLALTIEQIASRKHAVKEVRSYGKRGALVEATAMLTFKAGEIIGLNAVPKHAAERLIDLEAEEERRRDAEHKAQVEQREAEARRRAADKAAADAKAKRDGEARKAYDDSAELKAKFKTADDYIASLDPAPAKTLV